MKKKLTLAFALVLFNLSSVPAWAHAEHGQPQFGGVVAEAGEAQFEVVGKDGRLVVHVTNHGSPLDTTGASGKLTVLAGSSGVLVVALVNGRESVTAIVEGLGGGGVGLVLLAIAGAVSLAALLMI